MKLRSLEIDQFRKFDRAVRVDGIADGLNVICGPNEMGKSTLLAALHAVLFEKHRSKAKPILEMRSGSNTTSPVVTLAFELAGGGRYSVAKRFLGREPYARLVLPDGRRVDGDPAEEELQRLLHFGEASVRGADADTLGMWGLLWVRQGHSFLAPEFADSARNALQAALEAEVGVMTGGERGRALPAAIEEQLFELVGKRGDAKGRYAQVKDDLAKLDALLPELKEKQRRLAADIESLASQEKELKRLLADTAEEEDRRALAEAKKRRDAIVELQGKIREADVQAKLAETGLAAARAALKARRDLAASVGDARRHVDALATATAAAETAEADAALAVELQRGTVSALEATNLHTANAVRALRKSHEVALMAERLVAYEARHARALTAQGRVDQLTRQAARVLVTPDHVQAIRKALATRDGAVAAVNAVATEITFAIELGAVDRITLDGRPLTDPKTTLKVATESAIGIAGVGRIVVRPSIRDANKLVQNREKAERDLADALTAAGVVSLDEAERRLEEKRTALAQVELAKREVALLTPAEEGLKAGIAALTERITSLNAMCEASLKALGLAAAPARQKVEADLDAADAEAEQLANALAEARTTLAGPEQRWADAREVVTRTKTEAKAVADRWRRLTGDLETASATTAEADLECAVADAEAAHRRAGEAVAALRQSDLETLDAIDVRIERLARKIEGRKDRIQELRVGTATLRTSIQTQEGDGLEEKIRRAERDREQLDRERAFFDREVKVLTLLKQTLAAAEQEARERYMAPIVKRIQPYLQMLFPGSIVRVDESFQITGVVRNGGTMEDFARLSDGTREQIAVLTRLALAELLAEQGRPATVILDDALVFSDDDRLDRMFDILNAAARKTQILVLSCRKRLFDGLGGKRLKIEEVGSSTAVAAE